MEIVRERVHRARTSGEIHIEIHTNGTYDLYEACV